MQLEVQFALLYVSSNLKMWPPETQGKLFNKEDVDAEFHTSKLLYEWNLLFKEWLLITS